MEDFLIWGYPGLAVIGFIAGSILPMSSEAALSAALALGWPAWPCIAAVLVGNWLGASTNYCLGRLGRMEWIERYLRIRRDRIERTQRFLHGRGVWLAAVSFLPFLGNVVVVAFGVSRTPFWKVGSLMLVGRFLRYVVWMLLTQGVIGLVG